MAWAGALDCRGGGWPGILSHGVAGVMFYSKAMKAVHGGYFVAGTDTGVGKTQVALLLIRALRVAGKDAAGFKPICCGSREDAERLVAAAEGRLAINEVNP